MGNRGRFVAVTAAASGVALAAMRRRARARRLIANAVDTILPTHVAASSTDDGPEASKGHAPGHRHLPIVDDEPMPRRLRGRPWRKNLHGMRYPVSGN